MEQKNSSDKRFALLIDADNVSSKYIGVILDELSNYGIITYKRIYGDWTSTLHAKWKDTLLENSITPIQQFSYTTGKNATDSALIIDAMDIMYTKTVDGFCLVSSDSDFTRLAARIREAGLMVIGAGENKTPLPFRTACDVFKCLEVLLGEDVSKNDASKQKNGHGAQNAQLVLSRKKIEKTIIDIVTDNMNKERETGLGEIGSRLVKRYPDFDVRNYGTNQLSKLLAEFNSIKLVSSGKTMLVELADTHTNKQHHAQAAPVKPKPQAPATARTTHTLPARQKQQTPSDATSKQEVAAPAHENQARKEESVNVVRATRTLRRTSSLTSENTQVASTHVSGTAGTTIAAEAQEGAGSAGAAETPGTPRVATPLRSRKAGGRTAASARSKTASTKPSTAGTAQNALSEADGAHNGAHGYGREPRPQGGKAETQEGTKHAAAQSRTSSQRSGAPAAGSAQTGSAPTSTAPAAFPTLDALSAHITSLVAEHKNATISVPALGKLIRTRVPNFEPKAYSYAKLSDLLAHISTIELVHKNKSMFATLGDSSKK